MRELEQCERPFWRNVDTGMEFVNCVAVAVTLGWLWLIFAGIGWVVNKVAKGGGRV